MNCLRQKDGQIQSDKISLVSIYEHYQTNGNIAAIAPVIYGGNSQ